MYFSPLEQFSIIKIIPIFLGSFDFSFTNSSLLAILSCTLAFVIYNFACANSKLVPNAWQSVVEFMYEFIYFNVLAENVKKDGPLYFPMLFSIFSFLFFCNILGMIPYSFTVTSHIVVTLGLATMAFTAINIIGLRTHGFHMLSLFLPSGAPIALAPLLVMIEIVSYGFRVISLALRLFANMMSGHCLLKILAGFAWTMLSAGGLLTVMHVLPLVVIFAIVGLELCIAFLQAYVFTVLLCIYINDAISLH
jgi:ATP synthase subunit 6